MLFLFCKIIFSVFTRRHSFFFCEHSYKMGQIAESHQIAYFRNGFLRMLQQSAGGVQTVLHNELHERHSLMPLEIGAESGTVHAHFSGNIVERNRVDVMCHDVCADLLHTPHVALDSYRLTGKRVICCGEDGRQDI